MSVSRASGCLGQPQLCAADRPRKTFATGEIKVPPPHSAGSKIIPPVSPVSLATLAPSQAGNGSCRLARKPTVRKSAPLCGLIPAPDLVEIRQVNLTERPWFRSENQGKLAHRTMLKRGTQNQDGTAKYRPKTLPARNTFPPPPQAHAAKISRDHVVPKIAIESSPWTRIALTRQKSVS